MNCRWCGAEIQVRPDGRTWESPADRSIKCGLGSHEPDRAPVVQSQYTRGALAGTLPPKRDLAR